jgi:hypothetical protein
MGAVSNVTAGAGHHLILALVGHFVLSSGMY